MGDLRRALISVSDKEGVVDFARALEGLGFEIVSTGGTMSTLQEAGVAVRAVSDITGVPEILGGRVKTLHPAVFGGILAQRHLSEDMTTLEEHGIGIVDVVAVNLYPFEQTAASHEVSDAEIIDQIDIGGVALLRAAAKNHRNVYAVVEPADYMEVIRVLNENREAENGAFRRRLAAKVFAHCSAYDRAIASYLRLTEETAEAPNGQALPEELQIALPLKQRLRYGENPHQVAAFYSDPSQSAPTLAHCRQIQGKELSYNNYLDADGGLEMVREFDEPVAVILKHANPCGVGRGDSAEKAYRKALAGDPVSAFGGIVAFNRPVDAKAAAAMVELFLEVVIAPAFDDEALKILAKKKNLRLLEAGDLAARRSGLSLRSVSGGVLAQMTDATAPRRETMTVPTRAQPDAEDWEGLIFAWKVVRWVRSNAIVYATVDRTLGIGAGQMSRIDAARLGLMKAEEKVEGAYLASDGFFPFPDVVELAAEHGVKAIIQPGGSIRDEESVAAADKHKMIMVMAGERHFRH